MEGSEASLSMKMGSLELDIVENVYALPMDGHVWLASNPGGTVQAGCSKPAVGGDEWLERKEILKMMVSETAKNVKSALKQKMVMLWSKIFLSFVKMICSGVEIQGWKWGSLARHIPNMHIYGSKLPPPPPPGLQSTSSDISYLWTALWNKQMIKSLLSYKYGMMKTTYQEEDNWNTSVQKGDVVEEWTKYDVGQQT